MLTFAVLLAAVSLIFESLIARRSRLLRKVAGRRVVVNLGVSLALSVLLGSLFGVAGLIALMAGLLSTIAAIPV